jgi:GTP-binding protein
MFVDVATVQVKAGDGGDGAVSFRKEKFIDRGGPDGGDGGRGGHVILRVDENLNTLVKFRYNQEIKAKNGEYGRKRRQHGANGEDLVVPVPVGTVALKDGVIIADLIEHGQEVVIAKGGDGGFGNAHFKSSTRQAPRVAELGEKGEAFELKLELKLLADVGLVGFPNAGKSTFLSVVSNARPEIADYAFTTLTPNLGVADFDEHNLLIADIPGLIEGASKGKGLGDEFLRHIERTAVLLHLIDVYEEDVAKAYKTITNELKAHNPELAKRPRIVVLTKIEGLEQELIDDQKKALQKVAAKGTPILAVSSKSHVGIIEVLRHAYDLVRKVREEEKAATEEVLEGVPVIELNETQQEAAWQVRLEEGRFIVTGSKIEKFASQTDFSNDFGVMRLRDIMKKMGISHDLIRKGAKPEDVVVIGESGEYQLELQ